MDCIHSADVGALADFCHQHRADVVAIDAPCAWSQTGASRLAERDLRFDGAVAQCFKTPTREKALASSSGFYQWVFNAERLYEELAGSCHLFDCKCQSAPVVVETFPHAVVCALAGRVVPAKPKASTRRKALRDAGYDDSPLRNIDFVDAALCALTARAVLDESWTSFGNAAEGFIVVPAHGTDLAIPPH